MFNDINIWRIIDESPSDTLDTITPVSKRAACLIARNKSNTLLNTEFFRFQGVVEMMKGLDYHHENLMNIINQLAQLNLADEKRKMELQAELLHEATAYLNRLGQVYYFITSDFVEGACPTASALAPTVFKFVIFRMKYSAHRSIDQPRGESAQVLATHAMTMSSMGGSLFEPKPGKPNNNLLGKTPEESMELIKRLWLDSFHMFQLRTENPAGCINFSIEKEHPFIIQEAYIVLKTVLGL